MKKLKDKLLTAGIIVEIAIILVFIISIYTNQAWLKNILEQFV